MHATDYGEEAADTWLTQADQAGNIGSNIINILHGELNINKAN